MLYVVLLLAHGYVFGHQDLIEITGYLNYLDDPTLYGKDFYIQNITARIPNERWMFVQVLDFFNIRSPWSFLVAHFVVAVTMLSGLILIAQHLIKDHLFAFLAVFATTVVFYKINLGGNEIYYNTLTSSLVSKAIATWSIFFLLRNKVTTAILMLIPTSFIHPLVGIQLFLIFSAIISVQQIKAGKFLAELRKLWSIPAYLLTAGIWLFFLQQQFSEGSLSDATFFEIISFRLAHHFIPATFGLKNYLILSPLIIFAWIYFWKKSQTLFWFFNFSILGLLVYTIGVEIFNNALFLSTQWFKTTIWLKFFSMMAVSALAYDLFQKYIPRLIKPFTIIFLVALTGFTLLLFRKLPDRHITSFDMPWKGQYNDEIAMARLAQRVTPEDALFVTPAYFTHLKYYGMRSTYVDYKAMVHHKTVLPEWYKRVNEIYMFNNTTNMNSSQRVSSPLTTMITSPDWISFSALGITHLITDEPIDLDATLLGQKGKYYLYELK
ncbi:MAG: hypothetical protein DWQ02_22585 [Bacteroidetes bacterium]|nr:MAG: hypothetical protein DWQ02_22585 [Bacteroidota bacterium]